MVAFFHLSRDNYGEQLKLALDAYHPYSSLVKQNGAHGLRTILRLSKVMYGDKLNSNSISSTLKYL